MTTRDNPQTTHLATPVHRASAGPLSPSATRETRPDEIPPTGPSSQPGRTPVDAHISSAGLGLVFDPSLYIHVTTHSDLERIRIASENRLRALTLGTGPEKDGVSADGAERGFGLDESHPDVARQSGIVAALDALEKDAEKLMTRAFRRSPVHPWVKAQRGFGDKQVARLLGAIGDPYWHTAEDRPRTVSELWAYCGLHVLPASPSQADTHLHRAGEDQPPAGHIRDDTHPDLAGGTQTSDPGQRRNAAHSWPAGVAARRRKGVRANWSTEAKTRAYLIAVSCMKQPKGSTYRDAYDTRRAHTAVTHPEWTPGHSHNDALRVTSKAILRDFWRESKRLHDQQYAAQPDRAA